MDNERLTKWAYGDHITLRDWSN